jgi:hypothetical protein
VPRIFAIGDPQGPFSKFLEVLARHGLLAGDRLASDVTLVSIGDHFDYDHKDPVTAAREGLQLLRWLADHDRDQVRILLGNHDAARVMELATISDVDFATARTCSAEVYVRSFGHLPPQHVVQRDYASFTTEQRTLVQELLVAGRFRLAAAGTLADGRACLLTHAGITAGECAQLGAELQAVALAAALNGFLDAAVASVGPRWHAGTPSPLSLEPLHRAGCDGIEGDGLLYHRPSRHGARPRRFDPSGMPDEPVQVVGHSGHHKCLEELGDWATPAARARLRGGIRSISRTRDGLAYDLGTAGYLILIDGELRRVPAHEVELLELASLASID